MRWAVGPVAEEYQHISINPARWGLKIHCQECKLTGEAARQYHIKRAQQEVEK